MLVNEFLDRYSTPDNREAMRKDLVVVVDENNQNTPIANVLNLSDKVKALLLANNLVLMRDLQTISKSKFMALYYIGRKKVQRLERVMEAFNIIFKVD